MVKKCNTISLAIFLVVLLLSAHRVAAAVTKLNDIRGGQHKGFIRLVLDAEGARPLMIGPATTEGVIIVYEQLELMRKPSVLFRSMVRGAANVSHHRQVDSSVIEIKFKNPDTAVRSFYMRASSKGKDAYRLILDLHPPGSAAAGPGELVPVASAKTAMPAPTPAPAPATVPPQAAAEVSDRPLPAVGSSLQSAENQPKVLQTESASQTEQVEIASSEQKQEIHPVKPPPNARNEGEKENLSNPPSQEKSSPAGATELPSVRNEFRDEQEKSIAPSKGVTPMAEKRAQIVAVQPPQSGIENVMPRQAASHVRKSPMYKQDSIGLVELTLKLLSIALSCLVILFLHRANKMASNRHDTILELKHPVNARQRR